MQSLTSDVLFYSASLWQRACTQLLSSVCLLHRVLCVLTIEEIVTVHTVWYKYMCWRRWTKKCRLLPHIWTTMLKLHLIDLLIVYLLYSQLCNKYSDKSNRWNLGLRLSVASSAVSAISSSPSATTLLIAADRVAWRIVSNSTVVHTKMGHVRFFIPFARLDIVFLFTKFESSSFSHSWDMNGAPKI